uniref:WW domain-containing protein n=1 Tax=Globisporangium ultimum (strain ATCC 200006 / CBS 805.95 / DAOM BR144) TaxID=431595 RepID=K3WMU7_GLOUD
MLLFGGNLSGGVNKSDHQPHNANIEAEKADEGIGRTKQLRTEGDVATPRTDILHRLTNHELRLLEELERTRSKLQAEWRHKIVDFQQQQGQPGKNASTAIAEQLGLSRSPVKTDDDTLNALMRSKTLVRSSNQSTKPILKHKKSRKAPNEARIGANLSISAADSVNLPRLRSSLDMLPILTTTGETPFELGLDSESSSSSRSPIQGQHVLPIFRLPTVNVVGAATVLAQKEVEMLEEDRDRKEASDALGLSLEEIAMLEAGLNEGGDQKKTAWGISSRHGGDPNQNSPGHTLPGMPSRQLKHATNRRHDKRQKCKADCRKLCNGAVRAQRGDSLRKELESALTNVQHLTRLVKDDIVLAQKICPANELRTSLYFKRWGRDKVENIFRRLLFNLQGIAFQRWHQVVVQEKQEEKLQAYLMYKGSKKLDHFLLNWSQRKLRQAWTKWWSDIAHVKALERLVVELDAIHVIQRAWQGYRGRMFAYLVKTQRLFAQQSAAATRIQRMFRGSVTRKFFRLKQLHKRRHIAAIKIQAAGRGYVARQLARQIRRKRRHFVVASKIQAIYRGRKARRGVATLRRNRRVTQAALVIQRRYRGRLRRVKFIRRQMERYMAAAATKIQKIARGRRARWILRDLKEQAKQRRILEHASAIKIQKVYRSHRSRLSTELKLLALREKNRWRAKAATTIQKRMRSYLAKKCVQRVREAHAAQLVTLARTWVEYWNEDTSSWFYYNQENGEAIWTPPPTGYTKADGNLVLQNGKIIPDPLDGNISEAMRTRKATHLGSGKSKDDTDNDQEEEHAHEHDNDDDDEDKLCVECEDEDARRRCDQCEDVFCDACYDKLHRSSKREKHTWKAMGSLRCIECEKMKATRWCYVCQDPYCLGCFTIIHSKGNKVNHDWTDMSTFKKAAKQQQRQQAEMENAQTYDEFMASHEYQYVNELTADESAPQAVYPAEGEWMTLVDESSGQPYYYNSYTGESRWA